MLLFSSQLATGLLFISFSSLSATDICWQEQNCSVFNSETAAQVVQFYIIFLNLPVALNCAIIRPIKPLDVAMLVQLQLETSGITNGKLCFKILRGQYYQFHHISNTSIENTILFVYGPTQ